MDKSADKKPHKDKKRKPSQRQDLSGKKEKKPFSWRPVAVACGIVLLVIVLLYPAGRDYYKTMRTEQRLQAQLEAVTERNDAVEAENEALQTPEGVENQARNEYGWVREDENSVVVTNQEGTVDNASRLPDHLDIDSIHAPSTWYYNILDTIFFVHE